MRGVPVRIEVGPRDLEKGQVVLVRRDNGEKEFVLSYELPIRLPELLGQVQNDMLKRALEFREVNTRRCSDYSEFKKIIEEKRGFVVADWCGEGGCEEKIKDETKATIRCLPSGLKPASGKCIACGETADAAAYFARAY
jgi:prolyl-tRNA synthetase